MSTRTSVAEMRIPGSGLRVCGTVKAFTPYGAVVKLDGQGRRDAGIVAGLILDLALLTPDGLQTGSARVVTRDGDTVVVLPAASAKHVEHRRLGRRECAFPVSLRCIHAPGECGAWIEAEAVNISLGGMRVRTSARCGARSNVELRFDPGERNCTRQARSYGDDGVMLVADDPGNFMRVRASVVWDKCSPGGSLLGLQFAGMLPEHRLRLARILAGTDAEPG